MLPDDLIQHLIQQQEVMALPANYIILDFHKYIRNIPVLISGGVKVMSEDDEGHEILLYHIHPGESCIMSILGAINQTTSKVKAVTISPTEIVFIRPDQVYDLVTRDPKWFQFIMQLYQTRFEELLQTVTRGNFDSIDEKVLFHLRERSSVLKSKIIPITHQTIANEIGSAREVVSRALKQMEHSGRIKLMRGKVELLEP
jgi:CRP/FNR family transcriptional regulator, anaerobic regulatory protein